MEEKRHISAFTIIIIFLCISLAGIALIPLLPVKLSPSYSLPGLSVGFSMYGNSSRVVEMSATSKLEAMLARLNGVKKIYSRSGNGWGRITLELDKHTPIDVARFEASTIVRQTWGELPNSVTYPYISVKRPDEKSNRSFLDYTLNSSALPIIIQNYAENNIKTKLSEISGIYKIEVRGATPMEWQIEYDAVQLENLGLTSNDISNSIRQHLQTDFLGVGKYQDKDNKNSFISIVLAPEDNIDEIDPTLISIKTKGGEVVQLDRIVKIRHTEQAPNNYFRINGLNSIYISIFAEETANQLELSKRIKSEIETIKTQLPYGYELYKSYDATEYIEKELDKIYIRSGLTILILLLFVFIITRNLKYLFIIITSLSINLAIAIIFYYLLKLEIQLYSLAGITISLSLIIDNTIMMTDHILHKNNRRVFLPILTATLTTVGALSIIFFLDEKIRLNLQDFAAVVMVNLLVSLLIALFLVPAMIEKIELRKKTKKNNIKTVRKRFVILFNRIYKKIIGILSYRKWITYTLLILLFGTPIFLLPDKIENKDSLWAKYYNKTIGSNVYQKSIRPMSDIILGGTLRLFVEKVSGGGYYNRINETVLIIQAAMPNGTTLEQMNHLIHRMETYLTSFPQIKQFQTNINSPNEASIRVFFTKEAAETAFPYSLKADVITKALELGGGSWSVYGLADNSFNNDVREVAGEMKIKLLGYNYDELYAWADTLKRTLLSYRRIKDVTIGSDFNWLKSDYKEFVFNLNKKELSVSNIYPSSLFSSISETFARERYIGSIVVKGGTEAIKLNSIQSKSYDIWAMKNIGNEIKLSQIAEISKEQSPQEVVKENQQYRLAIQYSYIGSSKMGNKVLKKEVENINKKLPMGYKAEEVGWNNWWNTNSNKSYWLIGLLFVIIFFTTSILFNSIKQPFTIILTIPTTFIGVFLTFFIFNLKFDQGGFASFILLSGITVNASIYILNEYNIIRKKHHNILAINAYIKAWNSKIIPIMLTVVSTILGFIPFLVGVSKESFWFPLAAGTIGGLVASLISIFLLLPIMIIRKRNLRRS